MQLEVRIASLHIIACTVVCSRGVRWLTRRGCLLPSRGEALPNVLVGITEGSKRIRKWEVSGT